MVHLIGIPVLLLIGFGVGRISKPKVAAAVKQAETVAVTEVKKI